MEVLGLVQWINKQEWLKFAIFDYETRGKAGLDFFAAEKFNRNKQAASERIKFFLMAKNRETILNDAIALWVQQNNDIPKERERLERLIHGTEPVDTPEEHLARLQLRSEYLRVSKMASRD